MPAILSTAAMEQSTYLITITYKDEDGNAVTPVTSTWTLTDTDGNVINEREDVAIASPSTADTVTLSGSDLTVIDGDRDLIFTAEGTYTSSTVTASAFKASVKFTVQALVAV